MLALTQFETCSKTAPAPSSASTTLQSPAPALLPASAESSKAPAVGSDGTRVYEIGDTGPAGGIIFYDKGSDEDGWRYLEAAPSDQSASFPWFSGTFKYIFDMKTDTAVGAGKANTDAIVAAQGEGAYAASLCKDRNINGFADWFLPSKDELDLMYRNLKKAGLGGFGESQLWSSSLGINNEVAWNQRFSDGSQDYGDFSNYDRCSVRACRAF
ncbi:MAG: hypothetical protein WCL50_17470 [Spirochaetota bacterium]